MDAKRFAKDFPVVCVGGSAGGLDAYIRLLRNLRADLRGDAASAAREENDAVLVDRDRRGRGHRRGARHRDDRVTLTLRVAHVDEIIPYWIGEIERVLVGPVEPVPFGRQPTDLVRTLTVDRDRTLPTHELYARLDNSLERVMRRLLELDERQVSRRGLDKIRGEMTVKQIVDVMLAGHLEEHCRQLAAALEAEPPARA